MKLRVLDIGGTKMSSGVWQATGLTERLVKPTPTHLPERMIQLGVDKVEDCSPEFIRKL